MSTIKGTWINGQVLLNAPADWPDGTSLLIEPIVKEEIFGIREEDWPETPEARAERTCFHEALSPRHRHDG